MIERFIITETQNGNCEGYLESNPDVRVCESPEVLFNGARVLLGTGMKPEALLTSRWKGKDFDNFVPETIGELAKWDMIGLQFRPYDGDDDE